MACRDDPGHFRLVAVLYGEPKVRDFIERIRAADICRISVANHVELSMVVESQLGPNGMRQADAFLRRADVVVEPVTIEQGDLSRQAFVDFGKAGTRRA
jgi:ribonuclease VapC